MIGCNPFMTQTQKSVFWSPPPVHMLTHEPNALPKRPLFLNFSDIGPAYFLYFLSQNFLSPFLVFSWRNLFAQVNRYFFYSLCGRRHTRLASTFPCPHASTLAWPPTPSCGRRKWMTPWLNTSILIRLMIALVGKALGEVFAIKRQGQELVYCCDSHAGVTK